MRIHHEQEELESKRVDFESGGSRNRCDGLAVQGIRFAV
jgi:hypothetical protein